MTNRVILVPYNPDWPRRFEEEPSVLGALFASVEVVIEHVGSTAVPGHGAKPVIDSIVGVRQLAEIETRIPLLEVAGYEYVPEYEKQLSERRDFRKPRVGTREFHLHCVVEGSEFWIRQLAFRDYLRAHPETSSAYYDLKRDLAARLTKAGYTDAKSSFIESVLAAAMEGS